MFFTKKIKKQERIKTIKRLQAEIVADLDMYLNRLYKEQKNTEAMNTENIIGKLMEFFRQQINKEEK